MNGALFCIFHCPEQLLAFKGLFWHTDLIISTRMTEEFAGLLLYNEMSSLF